MKQNILIDKGYKIRKAERARARAITAQLLSLASPQHFNNVCLNAALPEHDCLNRFLE